MPGARELFKTIERCAFLVGRGRAGYPLVEARLLKEPPPMRKPARLVLLAPAAILASLLAFQRPRPATGREAQAAIDSTEGQELPTWRTWRSSRRPSSRSRTTTSTQPHQPQGDVPSRSRPWSGRYAEVMVEVGRAACDDRPANRGAGRRFRDPRTPRRRRRAGADRSQAAGCGQRQPEHFREPRAGHRGQCIQELDYRRSTPSGGPAQDARGLQLHAREPRHPVGPARRSSYAAINGMLSSWNPHFLAAKPDVYKEMKVQTAASSAGLGFVISMIEDKLTVRKVLKNTPAYKGGVKEGRRHHPDRQRLDRQHGVQERSSHARQARHQGQHSWSRTRGRAAGVST